MKPRPLLRLVGLSVFLGLATLALPLAAQAGVRVSVGIGVPGLCTKSPVILLTLWSIGTISPHFEVKKRPKSPQ